MNKLIFLATMLFFATANATAVVKLTKYGKEPVADGSYVISSVTQLDLTRANLFHPLNITGNGIQLWATLFGNVSNVCTIETDFLLSNNISGLDFLTSLYSGPPMTIECEQDAYTEGPYKAVRISL